jgi:hypothetical protein
MSKGSICAKLWNTKDLEFFQPKETSIYICLYEIIQPICKSRVTLAALH